MSDEQAYRAVVYPCPCCTRPLKCHLEGDNVILFCARGMTGCKCDSMNTGERGDTAKEAYEKLVAQFELWEMSQVL